MDSIYKDRQGGLDVYWIDNTDTGGKIFLKEESVKRYIRRGYRLIDLADADKPRGNPLRHRYKQSVNIPLSYAKDFTTQELREHYKALVGNPRGLNRDTLIAGLRGTEFDEHAYGETSAPRRNISGSDILPPQYKLNYLKVPGLKKLEPSFPVEIFPADDFDIEFRFWGSRNYDVYEAFQLSKPYELLRIMAVCYDIVIDGKHSQFEHRFLTRVKFTSRGIRGAKQIMKHYGQLEGLPILPKDWQYFQFIN